MQSRLRNAALRPIAAALAAVCLMASGGASAWAAEPAAAAHGSAQTEAAAMADAVADGLARSIAPQPVRHVLVKALGTGASVEEAEQAALAAARTMAAKHYAALGGEQALAPDAPRLVNRHKYPQLGFAAARVLALVEIRLRANAAEAGTALPQLSATVQGSALTLSASRDGEALVALDTGKDLDLLPGGGGGYRLRAGKPLRVALPEGVRPALCVLACTGGISAPATAESVEEAFVKSRAGRVHLDKGRGVVSECVEIAVGPGHGSRGARMQGSQSPVNMTGAAGRDAALPDAGTKAP
jgi:hypothetical protein